jgi:hypothetical protein
MAEHRTPEFHRVADPNPFVRWVARHPLGWGLASGLVIAAWFWVLRSSPVETLAVGFVVGALNWFLWRRGGPAHGWRARMLRRFPRR